MKVGDRVKVHSFGIDFEVEVTKVEAGGFEGRYELIKGKKPVIGFWSWSDVESLKTLKQKFKDGDTFAGLHYTYKRLGGEWYIETEFTDETIHETLKQPNPKGYAINKAGILNQESKNPS